MTRIIRVKKTAMRILNPDLDYENCLLANHIPLIDEYWPAVPNHYQTILLNAAHTLHKNIELNPNCKTRMSWAVPTNPSLSDRNVKNEFLCQLLEIQYSFLPQIFIAPMLHFWSHLQYNTSVNFHEYVFSLQGIKLCYMVEQIKPFLS